MRKPFRISTKIWFSLSILIFGYFVSMVFGYILFKNTESRLKAVSSSLFPASKKSQLALGAFQEQIKFYNDAVMLGEESFLESASKKSLDVIHLLETIATLTGVPTPQKRRIQHTINELRIFRNQAQKTYRILTNTFEYEALDPAKSEKAVADAKSLSEETKRLEQSITAYETHFSNTLKEELADINQEAHHQQILNFAVFILVVTVALALIALIISRSISRPLQKTFMLENAVEQSADGIAVMDMNQSLLFGNQGWVDMHGLPGKPMDIVGSPMSTFFPEEAYQNQFLSMIASVKQTGSIQWETDHLHQDGHVFPSRMSINLLTGGHKPPSFVIIARDITEQKEAEKAIRERTQQLNETLQKVEQANHKILESIQYAKLIQGSLLPNMDHIKLYLPNSFFIWMPRDIVGGDIYFSASNDKGIIIVIIDCTGHGVPGAFMTMIASSGIRRIVGDGECYDPAIILKKLNFIVKTSLQQDTDHALSDDGLDASVCFIDQEANTLTFSGAKLPLFFALKNEIHMIKGDKQSIGYRKSDLKFEYHNHVIPIESQMAVYMITDGYIDQLGGTKHRRFGTKRFKEMLFTHHTKPFWEQREIFVQTFNDFQGAEERMDDVTVIGFQIDPT